MNRRDFFQKIIHSDAAQAPRVQSGTSLLSPWQPTASNPWDFSAANYLYNRLGFSARHIELNAAVSQTPQQLVETLLDDALLSSPNLPPPPQDSEIWLQHPPYVGPDGPIFKIEYSTYQTAKVDLKGDWIRQLAQPVSMLRERMMLFWANHFVIGAEKIYPPQMIYKFCDYLRQNPWGNFRQMIKDITIQPAMLIYLDGAWNEISNINENYARELLELFTMGRTDKMGVENYTQKDIRLVAQALVGWRYDNQTLSPELMPPIFANYYFDFNTKTTPFDAAPKVYGLAQAHRYALFQESLDKIEGDIIDLIFERRASEIAYHIVEKIYSEFVYHDTSGIDAKSVIQELADLFLLSDWELKPMLTKLFESEHFFERTHRGSSIKSPVDLSVGILRKLDINPTLSQCCTIRLICSEMDQEILQPPNVKGWPGYRGWTNSTSLPKRNYAVLRDLILNGSIPSRGLSPHTGSPFDAVNWGDQSVLTWATQFSQVNGDYLLFVTQLSEFLLPLVISSDELTQIATDNGPLHFYEWPSLPDDQRVLIIRKVAFALTQLAEFELQ
ncbi:MAG: DUF1800 family protein [bacterium]